MVCWQLHETNKTRLVRMDGSWRVLEANSVRKRMQHVGFQRKIYLTAKESHLLRPVIHPCRTSYGPFKAKSKLTQKRTLQPQPGQDLRLPAGKVWFEATARASRSPRLRFLGLMVSGLGLTASNGSCIQCMSDVLECML